MNFFSLDQFLNRDPLIVNPTTPLIDIIGQMNRSSVANCNFNKDDESHRFPADCILVMADSQLVGIFTKSDLLRLTAEGKTLADMTIGEAMTQPVTTFLENEVQDLSAILNLINQHQIHHLPILDKDNQLLGIITQNSLLQAFNLEDIYRVDTILDARERKQLELSLQASEAKLSQVLDSLCAAIVNFRVFENRDWEYDYWSSGCEILFGYTAQEFMADKNLWLSRVFPKDRETIIMPLFEDFFRGGNTNAEYRFYHKDGSVRWIVSTYSSQQIETNCWTIAVVNQDITARKQAELEIRKFFFLAENSSEFIGMCDPDFVPLYANEAAKQLVGLDNLEQYSDLSVKDFFFPEDQDFIINQFFPQVLREGRAEVEIRFLHFQTGEALWMIYNVHCIRDENDRPIALATLSRNISDRKNTEFALKQQIAREHLLAEITKLFTKPSMLKIYFKLP